MSPLRNSYRLCWIPFLALALSLTASARVAIDQRSALDKYVARKDPVTKWERVRLLKGEGFTGHILKLTSQKWRDSDEVSQPVWTHWLEIVRPEKVSHDKALLFITGGNFEDAPREAIDGTYANMARVSESVVAVLRNVPAQPQIFAGEGDEERLEDNLLALSWQKAMETADPEWIGQFAMAKAATRAMDAVQDYLKNGVEQKTEINGFVVTGASKRGWTTWLTGAVDDRVVAIMPIVIDLLNVEASMRHHYAVYGFWSPALHDYVRHKIQPRLGTPALDMVFSLVDPYVYRDRLTMPKYILNGSGDQFFLPDSSQFYFDDLKGENYLRYVPNAGHGLKDSDAIQTLTAFYSAVIQGAPLPEFSWEYGSPGEVTVRTKSKPTKVRLWRATNTERRDFRIDRLGPEWKSKPLKPASEGVYTAKVSEPGKGWTAYMVEMTFPSPIRYPFKFTTPVRVIPDTRPYENKPIQNNMEHKADRAWVEEE